MPTYVNPNACDACATEHLGPLCVYICPNDLMVLDQGQNKGINQEPELCSECYACVKPCPEEAIHVRGYADFVPLEAEVQPHRIENGLTWTVRFRDGRELESSPIPPAPAPPEPSCPTRSSPKTQYPIYGDRAWPANEGGWASTNSPPC